MTLDHVREAKESLEREGLTPSYNAVLERLGHGSKRDVARLMQQLTADVPVPSLSDPPVPPLGAVPLPALAALGADPPVPPLPPEPPLPEPPTPPLPDPPAPPLPPAPPPPWPPAAEAALLAQATQAVQQAHDAVQALERRHQSLKEERREVERRRLTLQASQPRRRSAVALVREQLLVAIQNEWAAVEAERAAAEEDANEAYHMQQVATTRVQNLKTNATQAWATMRKHQQTAATLADPWRQESLAQARAAEEQLATLAGQHEARLLAEDPSRRPSWLQD